MNFKGIVIHHSESEFGSAVMIDGWHKQRGFDSIGYHAVILNGQIESTHYMELLDGQIEMGRSWDKQGAHAKMCNDRFGICLIGMDKFTDKQFDALLMLCAAVQKEHGFETDKIVGHYECPDGKESCPGFDVSEVRRLLSSESEVWNG